MDQSFGDYVITEEEREQLSSTDVDERNQAVQKVVLKYTFDPEKKTSISGATSSPAARAPWQILSKHPFLFGCRSLGSKQ